MIRIIPRQIPHAPAGSLKIFFRLLLSGRLVEGDACRRFEDEFAGYLGMPHAVALSSGRVGLYLLLREMGVGPGDEVLVPSLTCPVVPSVICAAGAVPVFIDSDPGTFTMDPAALERAAGPRTKAAVVTHIEGVPCAMQPIMAFARERGIKVIEDCAQALGAEYEGRKAGTFGDAAYFSFAFGKQINTMGGGMVVTADAGLARRMRRHVDEGRGRAVIPLAVKYALQCGMELFLFRTMFALFIFPALLAGNMLGIDPITFFFEDAGDFNAAEASVGRLTNLQAAFGSIRLQSIGADLARRREIAGRLTRDLPATVRKQRALPGSLPAYCYYSIRSTDRAAVRSALLRRGLDTQPSWNRSCASLPRFSSWARPCPVADQLEADVIFLPIAPELNDQDVVYMISVLRSSFA